MANVEHATSLFVTGLPNPHAMEKQRLSIMVPQVQQTANYPQIKQRLQKHIGATRVQIERLDAALSYVAPN